MDPAARIASLEQALQDLTERHQLLATLDAATQPLVEPRDIMQTTARILAEHLDVARCAYANVIDERIFDITGDWPRGVPSIVGRWEVAAFGDACLRNMLDNTPYVVDDTDTDPRLSPETLAAYRATTIRAVICVPLHKQGVFTAAMAVHATAPRRWKPAEIELVKMVVGRCWEALERAVVIGNRIAAERMLAEHRARLDYAVKLSGVGFWYCDLPFDELLWDAQVKAHFWLPPDARVTIELFYARIHPEDREPTRAAIDLSIANRGTYDVVYRTVNPADGAVKHIRALGGAAYAEDGTPVRFDGTTVDITELREADRRKDEFLATLAHELRNPLAPIRSGLEILGNGAKPALGERVIGMMRRQVTHLVRMVDDLLDISRVTLGKLVLAPEHGDVRTAIENAVEITQEMFHERKQQLDLKLAGTSLPAYLDVTRIAQVFANLLSNASKYTPVGGHVEVSAERDRDTAVVRIRDNGIGIPPAKLAQVFELFAQLDGSIDRAHGGLGLGLTIARRLVEMHAGTITAHSLGLGHGTTFEVRLPLARPAASTSPPVDVPAAATGLDILVVDDNVDAATLLALLLEAAGHAVRVAHTGAQALVVAAAGRPDVVLLDIGLPELDGYEVARRMRADPALAGVTLVAVTGWGAEGDRKRSKEAGFDHHLVKPVEYAVLDELLARLKR